VINFNAKGESIQIYGPGSGSDGLGNPTKTWDVDKGTFYGIVTRPGSRDVEEAQLGNSGTVAAAGKKLIAPSDADIATGDRLEIGGITYECQGSSEEWVVKKNGTAHHLEILLTRVVE
jgi:hypothetical protein